MHNLERSIEKQIGLNIIKIQKSTSSINLSNNVEEKKINYPYPQRAYTEFLINNKQNCKLCLKNNH